jgi:hypothetical protein
VIATWRRLASLGAGRTADGALRSRGSAAGWICWGLLGAAAAAGVEPLELVRIAGGLSRPLGVVDAGDGSGRLFVLEQAGRVLILADGAVETTPFLDLSGRVSCCGERGLLGLAFHPEYEANGELFVAYSDSRGDTVVSRFSVGSDPDRVDPASETEVLTVPQPFANHNGGHLAFGPDGYLYVGTGDGGGGGDPQGNAQRLDTLLGKILRLDVDGRPYAVPPDNPFVGAAAARPEIWAYGLRNPWRFAFDAGSGQHFLYIADVGQNRFEEINVVGAAIAGVNYGWRVMEGRVCFNPSPGCAMAGLTQPVHVYDHDDGCSVTGGFVYRGSAMPDLQGHYLYADYCGGWVRSFRFDGGAAVDHREWQIGDVGRVTSFGMDGAGEVYLTSSNGRVYRLVRA